MKFEVGIPFDPVISLWRKCPAENKEENSQCAIIMKRSLRYIAK